MSRFIVFLLLFLPVLSLAQNVRVSGIVKDDKSGETLIGANVLFAEGAGYKDIQNFSYNILRYFVIYGINTWVSSGPFPVTRSRHLSKIVYEDQMHVNRINSIFLIT